MMWKAVGTLDKLAKSPIRSLRVFERGVHSECLGSCQSWTLECYLHQQHRPLILRSQWLVLHLTVRQAASRMKGRVFHRPTRKLVESFAWLNPQSGEHDDAVPQPILVTHEDETLRYDLHCAIPYPLVWARLFGVLSETPSNSELWVLFRRSACISWHS